MNIDNNVVNNDIMYLQRVITTIKKSTRYTWREKEREREVDVKSSLNEVFKKNSFEALPFEQTPKVYILQLHKINLGGKQ